MLRLWLLVEPETHAFGYVVVGEQRAIHFRRLTRSHQTQICVFGHDPSPSWSKFPFIVLTLALKESIVATKIIYLRTLSFG